MSQKIILIRHGESEKNKGDQVGGNGKVLTSRGREQAEACAKELAKMLQDEGRNVNIYISCDRVQVKETGEIIARDLGLPLKRDKRYRPLNLGKLDGTKEQDRLESFHEVQKRLEMWQKGKLDVNRINIPDSESTKDYYKMGMNFFNNLKPDSVTILVGTRSDLNLMKNIVSGGTPFRENSYKSYDFDYCKIEWYEMMKFKPLVHKDEQTDKNISLSF